MDKRAFFIKYLIPIGLFISLCWAISPIVHKHVLKHSKISPKTIFVLTTFFYTSCVAVLALFEWQVIAKDLPKLDVWAWSLIAFTALIAGFLANYMYFYAIRDNNSSIVTALMYSSPIFTLLLSFFLIKEAINAMSVAGILLIVTGVICISLSSER